MILSQVARSARAQLIKKVSEVDPLICLHCGGEMRILSVLEEAPVIAVRCKAEISHITKPAGLEGFVCIAR